MHLAVDAIGIKHSGGAVVLLDFLSAAIGQPKINKITVFCSPQKTREFLLPTEQKVQEIELPQAEASYFYRVYWFEYLLAKECKRIGADTLLCMTGSGHAINTARHVNFIQQSLPFCKECKRLMNFDERVRFTVMKTLMRRSCKSASRVIVQTPTMKTWVSEQFKLEPNQVEVVVPNVELFRLDGNTINFDVDQLGLGPRLFYVGSNSPHKNVQTIVQGTQQLRKAIPNTTLFLTLSAKSLGTPLPGIVGLDYLSRPQLAAAYRQMDILVMPSLVETVGLPMLEAMSLGIPVLAADRPYAHDMCQDAALYFDPLSVDSFVQKSQQLLQDQELRNRMIKRGLELIEMRKNCAPYATMVDIVLNAR